MDLSKEELRRLSYVELRQFAKKHGIKANMKAEKLISAILSADEKPEAMMESFTSENTDVDRSLNQSEMSPDVIQNGSLSLRRKLRRFSEIHSVENTPEVPECSSEDSEVFLKTPVPSSLKRSGTFCIDEPVTPIEKQPKLDVDDDGSARKYNFRSHSTAPANNQSSVTVAKKVIISDDTTYVMQAPQSVTSSSKPPRKSILRRSEKRYSGKIGLSPQSSGTEKSRKSKVNFITPDRSLFEKSDSQTPRRSVKDRPKTPVVQSRSMKRKQAFSPARKSPKQLKITENVTTPKLVKNSFATKSDKGLQTDTPVPRTVEKKPTASVTRIRLAGRETASSMSGKKSAPEMNKVQTPNFKVIHQKAFEKMETLDEYHERKQNRMLTLTKSQQKARADNSSAKKTMPNKQGQLSAKSVSSQKPTPAKPSRIPQPFRGIPFIPVVKSIRKINTNFTSQSQSLLISSTKSADTGRNENPSKKCHRNLFNAGPVNPDVFQFGKGQPTENPASTTDENKRHTRRKFDLKASLAKKLPYKPHRGALKPLTDSALNQSQLNVSYMDPIKKKREQSREVLKGVRKNRRFDLQMSRRGLC